MLKIEGLHFAYPGAEELFHGIDLQLDAGQVMAIVGRNGAGKSTLLRLLNGLLRPGAGKIRVAGADIAALEVHEIARHVGTMYQSPGQQLFAGSCSEEVAFGPRRFGFPPERVGRAVTEALARCGLGEAAALHPLDLDQAAQRFLTLASVLATSPELLLLDEPQRGLDQTGRQRLREIIREEAAAGKAVVLICHDMDFVDANTDHVLALGRDEGSRRAGTQFLPSREFFADRDRLAWSGMVAPWRSRMEEFVRAALAERKASGHQ